ncbi:hypothetical protein BH09BAC6_BH09BAC6_31280 [soil metagenome]|jgi:hypothetical protein
MEHLDKAMKKQQLKYKFRDVVTIVFFWLLAIAMLCTIYYKFKIIHP